MISQDTTQRYDPDCSTCAHRVERHPSKRERPDRPRVMNYVCLVEGKAICEHGTRTQTVLVGERGFHSHVDGEPVWVYDCPCRKYDGDLGKWVLIDYEPCDSLECATMAPTE